MEQNNATEKKDNFFTKLLDKMYANKETKTVKPVVAWSILGGEFVLAGLIALIVMLCI